MGASLRVLVTGGAGFIGSHLADALVEKGHRVVVLDDFSAGSRDNLKGAAQDAEVMEADLRDLASVRRAASRCDLIFHLGALGSVPRSVAAPIPTHEVNVSGSVNVLEAAREAGVKRVVLASSSSVYGDSAESPKREERLGNAVSPYAVGKRAMELYAEVFARRYGVEMVALRYFNVYGPRQSPHSPYAAVVPLFFRAALTGARPVIFGDGEQSRDFTFVGDVVEANLRAGLAPLPDGSTLVANVACGGRVTVNDLWRSVARVTASTVAPEFRPPRAGDILHSSASIDRLRSWLGWVPSAPLDEGLACSLSFYRSLVEAGVAWKGMQGEKGQR